MSDSRARFEKMLNYDLDAAHAADGAFGRLYQQQQEQWVRAEEDKIKDKGGAVSAQDTANLKQQFNTEYWDKHKNELKTRTLAAYDGESSEQTADRIGNDVMDKAGSVVGGGISSMLMGGDFTGGISHGLRYAIMGGIMSIPIVGEFLAKVTAWIGSKVKSLFGGGESLSWDKAGEKVEGEKIKERMGQQLGQYADVNKLAEMVNQSGREFTAEEKAKYGASTSETLPAGDQRTAEQQAAAERGQLPGASGGQHLPDGTTVVSNAPGGAVTNTGSAVTPP